MDKSKYYCGIEIEGLSQNAHNCDLIDIFDSHGYNLHGYSADVGQSHFCLDTDGSINKFGKHNQRGYDDFEFKTPPFSVKFQRFPIPSHIMGAIKLFKEKCNPVINHSCGLHVHLSGVGMSIASEKERFRELMAESFKGYFVHKLREDYCRGEGRYEPVRRCGKWHYEFRIFNGTINERALQTAVFNCLNTVRRIKNKMRKEREAKNNQENFLTIPINNLV